MTPVVGSSGTPLLPRSGSQAWKGHPKLSDAGMTSWYSHWPVTPRSGHLSAV